MLNSYAEHRESKLGSVPNSSHPLKEAGLLGDLPVTTPLPTKMGYNLSSCKLSLIAAKKVTHFRDFTCKATRTRTGFACKVGSATKVSILQLK
jgi:hypothetical protein